MPRRIASFAVAAACLLPPLPARALSPSFTLAPGSPTLGVVPATPATILSPAVLPVPGAMPPPVIGIPPAVLGLAAADVITSLSLGRALAPPIAPGMQFYFSVDPGSVGIAFVPPPANVSCEAAGLQAQGDAFLSQPAGPPLPFANVRYIDANGTADSPCGPPPSRGLGLLEPVGAAPDNLFNLDLYPPEMVFTPGVGLTAPVYFTLAPGSPSLPVGAGPGDVLFVGPGVVLPAVFIPAAALGLVAGDAIDALDLSPAGAWFSLAPGSPSIAGCGISPATILGAVAAVPVCGWPIALAPGALGLFPGDNVDALSVAIDTDGDVIPDPLDNCESVPNSGVDADGDGVDNACDTCTVVANPQIAGPPPAPRAFVSHQRDDDTDGRGNACDFDYDQLGLVVGAADFGHMKASVGKNVAAATCGITGVMRCAKFDHDGAGVVIGVVDFNATKANVGKVLGAKCATCFPPFGPPAAPIVGKPVCQGPAACCAAVCP